ncbi:MAG: glycosyltransferase [Proteobacteria bacterium]|nr:glycosyltransferase [Pseudomonadota bacterium]
MIDVSIIYVNYFSSQEIEKSLLSFIKPLSRLRYEIIIADNSNNIKEFGNLQNITIANNIIFLQLNKNVGFGQGCNRAAEQAKGKYLFFLNPDTKYYKGTIKSLLSFYKKTENCGIVAPVLYNKDMSLQYSARKFPTILNQFFGRNSLLTKIDRKNDFTSNYMYQNEDYSKVLKVDWARAAAIIVDRKLFLQIGGFSPDYFMFAEDVDLSKRLYDKGLYTYLHPGLSVIHALGSTVNKSPIRKIWIHNKSLYIYFSKRYGLLQVLLFIAVIIRIVFISTIERIE